MKKKILCLILAVTAIGCLFGCSEIAVQSVSMPSAANVLVGDTYQLQATVSPSDATSKKLEWSSSDEAVATVSDSGLVIGVAEGEAVITAASIFGPSATCTVKVIANPLPEGVTNLIVNGTTKAEYTSLAAAVEEAQAGDILGIAPGSYFGAIVVDKSLTLIGSGASSTSLTVNENENAISVADGVLLDIRKLTVNVSGTGRGINPVNSDASLCDTTILLSEAVIRYGQTGRGISLGTDSDTYNNHITLNASYILCTDANGSSNVNNRGISFYGSADSSLTLVDSEVSAGHYALTLNSPALKVEIKNSKLTGFAALNIHNSGSEITVDGSTLVGRTFWSYPSNVYAAVVCDTASDTTLRITNSVIANEFSGEKANSYEMGIQIRNTGNKLYLDSQTYEGMISSNHAYAPNMVESVAGNEWYVDGELQAPIYIDYFVSAQNGTAQASGWYPAEPCLTIEAAVAKAQADLASGAEAVTIYVYAGEYETADGQLPVIEGILFLLDEGVTFTAAA